MSKVFISFTNQGRETRLYETNSIQAKELFQSLKASHPTASFGIYGAKDLITLKRTHRGLHTAKIANSLQELTRV